MSNDLFVRLERYGSTRERRQTENFFTELVAHLLREEPIARNEFVGLVAGDWAKYFCDGETRVQTQCMTESPSIRLSGLLLDLLLTCGGSELIIENKVDDALTDTQLSNYLEYASERQNARVAVISRQHQPVVDNYQGHANWARETLWWEIADKWARREKEFSCLHFIEGVLNFMDHHEMGPIKGFTNEAMQAPALWRGFVKNRDGVLARLNNQIPNPVWPENCDLQRANAAMFPPPRSRGSPGLRRPAMASTRCSPRSKAGYILVFSGFLVRRARVVPTAARNRTTGVHRLCGRLGSAGNQGGLRNES